MALWVSTRKHSRGSIVRHRFCLALRENHPVQDALVPIEQLSEEAIEARNKYVRNYRLNHARKFSREGCDMDVLKRLLVMSDPSISSLRKKIKKISEPYTKEVTEMYLPISKAEEEVKKKIRTKK